MSENVKVWEEDILLPTYGIGKAEKNPMFLEKRVYQGSSGVVYPIIRSNVVPTAVPSFG